MTVTYSLDVANTKFCGFTKLLCKWKGSIYKLLWKEVFCFSLGYAVLSVTYRLFLNEKQKNVFEMIVIYCESFIDLIPLSFVLGFYVSLVIGRWWNQFDAIPWPDRTCLLIGTFVHGSDERSRTVRRTLGRYLILMQMFTFQAVSTAVKKRFPTLDHVEAAGLMTKEEKSIYEKIDIQYGKWWLPAHWFASLARRAFKEGRIKDSVMLQRLMKEFLNYRSACGTMFNYDWISVPLVYTQVVTLATYTYSLSLLMGRQYLDPSRGYKKHEVDLYIPVFTLLQFFFYIGWLKVAEQIVNPYGEDDDDFELNWCLDRNAQVVYVLVDHFHSKHPRLRKDPFWDEFEPQLPHTKFTANNLTNPQLGSAVNLEIDPAKSEFLPLETFLEEDDDENNNYDSVRQRRRSINYRPSILMNILNGGFRRSLMRRSTKKDSVKSKPVRGIENAAYNTELDSRKNSLTPPRSRSSSTKFKKSPTNSRASSISKSIRENSINRRRQKTYDLQSAESLNQLNQQFNQTLPSSLPISIEGQEFERNQNIEASVCYEQRPSPTEKESGSFKTNEGPMPPIPEEPSRPPSMAILDSLQSNSSMEIMDALEPSSSIESKSGMNEFMLEANKVLEELDETVSKQGHKSTCKHLGYESCCSLSSNESTEEIDSEDVLDDNTISVVIEPNKGSHHEETETHF